MACDITAHQMVHPIQRSATGTDTACCARGSSRTPDTDEVQLNCSDLARRASPGRSAMPCGRHGSKPQDPDDCPHHYRSSVPERCTTPRGGSGGRQRGWAARRCCSGWAPASPTTHTPRCWRVCFGGQTTEIEGETAPPAWVVQCHRTSAWCCTCVLSLTWKTLTGLREVTCITS